MKKSKPKISIKKKTKKSPGIWYKTEFGYEMIDPITEGLWVVQSSGKISQVRLNRVINQLIGMHNEERPAKGVMKVAVI